MAGAAPEPGSEEAIREAWLLLRDPFATWSKGLQLGLLLAWLAWVPPRQWGGGVLLPALPILVAVVAAVFLYMHFQFKRTVLAALSPAKAREEIEGILARTRGWRGALEGMAVAVACMFGVLLFQLWAQTVPATPDDLYSPALGALIAWGLHQTVVHHRRADRLLGL